MPHSQGYRRKSRDLFQQPFRHHGLPHLSTYLHTYRVGDYVDIKANAAIHKGMPFKFYHGRTGQVWNVTPRALGVEVNKQVRNRIMRKRLHVRIEHIKHSKCRVDFLQRVKANDIARRKAKAEGKEPVGLKRVIEQPQPAAFVRTKNVQIETLRPLKYEDLL